MKIEWLLGIIPTIALGIIIFFLKRLLEKNDRHQEKTDAKLNAITDRIINMRLKQEKHEGKVDSEIEHILKDVNICLTEIKQIGQIKYDVNRVGDKVRDLDKKIKD